MTIEINYAGNLLAQRHPRNDGKGSKDCFHSTKIISLRHRSPKELFRFKVSFSQRLNGTRERLLFNSIFRLETFPRVIDATAKKSSF